MESGQWGEITKKIIESELLSLQSSDRSFCTIIVVNKRFPDEITYG